MLIAIEAALSRASGALSERAHLAFVGVLVAMIGLQALGEIADGPGLLLVLGAVAGGVAGATAYARADAARTLLSILSPAPLLFAASFLLISDTRELILPQDAPAAARIAVPGRTPVVVVAFDELQGTALTDSAGRIDAGRYPNFAELARAGTSFPNATTTSDLTPRAVPAIMTGTTPEPELLPIASQQPDSLFTLLGESYGMNVFEPITRICPEELCGEHAAPAGEDRLGSLASDLTAVYGHLLLPATLEGGLPAVDQSFEGFGEPESAEGELPRAESPSPPAEDGTTLLLPREGGEPADEGAPPIPGFTAPAESFLGRGADFAEWVEGINGDARTLDFLHTELPHVPYDHFHDGKRYPPGLLESDGLRDPQGRNPDSPAANRLIEQRFLFQLGYVDRLLGTLIRRLKAVGVWDSAIVVITSDHGVSFAPGEHRRLPNSRNLAEIASVPLIVKGPGMPRGRIDRAPARTIDIVPTIADLLGIELPFEVEGASLAAGAPERGSVEIEDRYGETLEISLAEFRRRREALIQRRLEVFGRGGWKEVFAAGAPPGLIGSRTTALGEVGPDAAGASAQIVEPERLTVREGFPVLPAAIRAELFGVEPGERVAVAMNGRIGAVAGAYEGGGKVRLFAMVPPALIRAGANTVTFFRLGDGRATRILSTASAG